MKMHKVAATAVAVLLLSGCATSAPVEPAKTEPVEVAPTPLYERTATDAEVAKFLENTYDTLPEKYKSADLRADVIEMGHVFCERAAEFGTTTGEEASLHINDLDKSDPVYMYNMSLALLVGAKSGEVFCPDFAGEPSN